MKKIPTLFEREFKNHKVVGIKPIFTEGMEEIIKDGCVPTIKFDGSCCAIIDGKFYKRYDCKKGKNPPKNAIPCCEPDPVTGHWPHWMLVDEFNPADKWFAEALINYLQDNNNKIEDGTYEAMGPHFQGNPSHYEKDILLRHGSVIADLTDYSFENIKEWLNNHNEEGIVFWKDGEPKCKIKRKDFGFDWPIK